MCSKQNCIGMMGIYIWALADHDDMASCFVSKCYGHSLPWLQVWTRQVASLAVDTDISHSEITFDQHKNVEKLEVNVTDSCGWNCNSSVRTKIFLHISNFILNVNS